MLLPREAEGGASEEIGGSGGFAIMSKVGFRVIAGIRDLIKVGLTFVL
jgi:hypothetical protein